MSAAIRVVKRLAFLTLISYSSLLLYFRTAKRLAFLILIGYSFSFLFLRSFLPEKWITDSEKVLNLVATGGGSVDNSFAATAFFFALIGERNVLFFTFAIGLVYLIFAFWGVRSFGREFFIRLLWILPCMLLNLFVSSKETIVLLLSIFIVAVWMITRRGLWVLLAVGILYGIYGGLIRLYFLLILLTWTYLMVLFRLRGAMRVAWMALPIVGVLMAPNSILEQMQGQRDVANLYAIQVGSDNRTAFYNPFPPVNSLNFIMNYVFAIVVFFLPFMFFFSIKELFLFVCLLSQAWFVWITNRTEFQDESSRAAIRMFTNLLMAHLLVLTIFEPDLGSFIRHLSSVSLYMVPIHLTALRKTT